MSHESESSNKELPAWARDLFSQFLDKHERLAHVLHLSIGGIHMIRGRHQALKVLLEVDGAIGGEDGKAKLERAIREKELAQREVDHDFPLLHEQATIALWSSLEALVRSLVAQWLMNVQSSWQCDTVRKIKVKIGDYESLDKFERCLWITDLVDQEVSGPLRSGVNRFESLLQPFGLSGVVEEQCQRALFELSQVRHALVHRNGTADRKLVEACPWLTVSPGQPLLITHNMWHSYAKALGDYVLELIQRVRVHFGLDRYGEEKKELPELLPNPSLLPTVSGGG